MSPVPQTSNRFAGEAMTENVVDINNPKVARYGSPQNPRKEYPKAMYDHETGHYLEAKNSAQEAALANRGFKTIPSPNHDYHKVRSGMRAPLKEVGPEREKVMTAEDIEALEAAELASIEEQANQQSPEEAEAEIAAQLGEAAKTKRKK